MAANPPARHSRESGNPASSLSISEHRQEVSQRDPRFRGGDDKEISAYWPAKAVRAAAAEGWDLTLLKNPCARIVSAEVCGPLTVRVRYDDGVTGTVRFEKSYLTAVLEPLNDPDFFNRVYVNHGALAWSDQLDMCPDAIYMKVVKDGECLLS